MFVLTCRSEGGMSVCLQGHGQNCCCLRYFLGEEEVGAFLVLLAAGNRKLRLLTCMQLGNVRISIYNTKHIFFYRSSIVYYEANIDY